MSLNRGTGLGYGQIRGEATGTGKARLIKAHRAALILETGEDPPDKDACHTCDNTICCNPDHLFWGSHRENMRDYIVKYGRVAVSKRPLPPRPFLPFEDEYLDPVADAARAALADDEPVPF